MPTPKSVSAERMVATYLALAVVLSLPFYYFIISTGQLEGGGGLYVLALMWAPGVAGLATRLVHQRNLRGMGWGWGATRYQAVSYLLPVLAATTVYGLVWALGIGGVSTEPLTTATGYSFPVELLLLGTLGVLMSAVSALGEELGWRGLLVPELARIRSYTQVSLITAVVWSVYHYPVMIFADYGSSAPTWYSLVMFTASIVGGSFVVTWLRLRSGSVWTGVILHASHNLFIQNLFDPLTIDRGWTEYVTTEFGAGLALCYAVAGYWCWRHRSELPRPGA